MLEPTFLSVPELADRWKQTERQILEHGAAMRLPLYFMFDGVAIPINDRWHLSHGHEYQDALRERESLEHSIRLARGELARNAAILRGHSEPSPYEDMPLSPERKNALVARIEAEEAKLEAVTLRLEKRERTRRRYECNGILRIMPGAAKAIMIEGKAFVDRAYLPGKPLTLRQEQGGFILDGPILALEGGRVWLSQGDLLASLAEVKAIESVDGQGSLDAGNRLATKPKQRSEAQDEAILEALRQMGHDPQRLPRNPPGKAGVKSQVWALLRTNKQVFVSRKVFGTAWQRLRDLSEIADAD